MNQIYPSRAYFWTQSCGLYTLPSQFKLLVECGHGLNVHHIVKLDPEYKKSLILAKFWVSYVIFIQVLAANCITWLFRRLEILFLNYISLSIIAYVATNSKATYNTYTHDHWSTIQTRKINYIKHQYFNSASARIANKNVMFFSVLNIIEARAQRYSLHRRCCG